MPANDAEPFANWLHRAVSAYRDRYPGDAARLQELRKLMEPGGELRDRRKFPGHLTASGLVLTPERDALVVVLHRRLNRWLQPGGHMEAGEMPHLAALREVAEETGLSDLTILPAFADDPTLPFDIDSHAIPASPVRGEPAHTHHDFRYVMVLGSDPTLRPAMDEVADVAVLPLDRIFRENLIPDLVRALSRLGDIRQ